MKSLCIVPARGGSKRIPRKNIIDSCGKPLIAYSIENVLNSGIFDKVIVSSDDGGILQVARDLGTEALMREKELSDDFSSSSKVIKSVVQRFETKYENICYLYATAPLLNEKILKEVYGESTKGDFSFLFSAVEFDYPVQRAFYLREKRVYMSDESQYFVRSQDLEEIYHDAGAFYFGKKETWLKEEMIFTPNSSVYLLPRNLICDIDTSQDLELAKKLLMLNKALM